MRKGLAMRALLDRWLSFNKKARGREPTPEGCLAVYVGEARERFVIRTECVNHRLFRALLEEAEEAHGHHFAADGPLELPCHAGEFTRVVDAIQREMAEERTAAAIIRCRGGGGIVMRSHSAAVHGRQVAVG
jgi:SAUR family protein